MQNKANLKNTGIDISACNTSGYGIFCGFCRRKNKPNFYPPELKRRRTNPIPCLAEVLTKADVKIGKGKSYKNEISAVFAFSAVNKKIRENPRNLWFNTPESYEY